MELVFHTTSGALWYGPPSTYLNDVTVYINLSLIRYKECTRDLGHEKLTGNAIIQIQIFDIRIYGLKFLKVRGFGTRVSSLENDGKCLRLKYVYVKFECISLRPLWPLAAPLSVLAQRPRHLPTCDPSARARCWNKMRLSVFICFHLACISGLRCESRTRRHLKYSARIRSLFCELFTLF